MNTDNELAYRPWGTVTPAFWTGGQDPPPPDPSPEPPHDPPAREPEPSGEEQQRAAIATSLTVRRALAAGDPRAADLAADLEQTMLRIHGPDHPATIEARELRAQATAEPTPSSPSDDWRRDALARASRYEQHVRQTYGPTSTQAAHWAQIRARIADMADPWRAATELSIAAAQVHLAQGDTEAARGLAEAAGRSWQGISDRRHAAALGQELAALMRAVGAQAPDAQTPAPPAGDPRPAPEAAT